MADLSRRTFLGASAAAAGAAVIGVPIATAAAGSGAAAAPTLAAGAAGAAAVGAKATGPLVVYVRDAAAGDVSIMVGTQEVAYHDPDLVARLARAAGNG
ncbi:MAG TPA: hypothetical protein VKD67_01085 [Acidimicrobiales bacterium]|jgi:hypothetical protein|nr:hypothetical protein [Acidimicrobiales bacterium]